MAEKSIEERELRAQKATSLEELEILAKDDGSYVRYFVAKNENTPVPVLEKLAEDKEVIVRSGVAENKNTPVTLLPV